MENKNEPSINTGRIKATDLPNYLLSHGVASITTNEIANMLVISPNQVPQRMQPLKKKRMIVAPAKGLWIPVPPEYLTWGAPPAIDMIDSLMKHMGVSYYIGWLSAAEHFGASHHAPQVFQVAVSRSIRDRVIGRSSIHFFHRSNIENIQTVLVESRGGRVPVSSREATLLDITNDVLIVGGLDNVANLVIELCEAEKPSIPLLLEMSEYYPASALRRLGWLLENFTEMEDVCLLKDAVSQRGVAPSLLDPYSERDGILDLGWDLRINKIVEPDV